MKKIFFVLLIFFFIFPSAILPADAVLPVSGILQTKDGTAISYDHYKQGFDSVVVVCPGFFNSKENRWMRKTVEMLLPGYDVIIFDFRGHGKSGGLYAWSAKEYLDVDAVLDYAVGQGYKHIGVLGFSLGASSAVIAASRRNDIESMVLISCPARFRDIDYHFWEPGMFADLKENIDTKWQGKGARIASIFLNKEAPLDAIRGMIGTAVFFIQGDSDWVLNKRHAKKLYEAAPGEKKIEIIKGGFHAERLIQLHYERMKDLILGWFRETLKQR